MNEQQRSTSFNIVCKLFKTLHKLLLSDNLKMVITMNYVSVINKYVGEYGGQDK